MNNRKNFLFTLFFISAIIMTGCASNSIEDNFASYDNSINEEEVKNSIFIDASPETSAIDLFYFDGANTTNSIIFESKYEKEILEILSGAKTEQVSVLEKNSLRAPLYGMTISKTDGYPLQVLYSNGYLIVNNGDIYSFDYDFENIFDSFSSETISQVQGATYFPCIDILLALEPNKASDFLTLVSDSEKNPETGIQFNLINYSFKDKNLLFTGEFFNTTDEMFTYGVAFELRKRIGNKFYLMPVKGDYNYSFIEIANVLEPGFANTLDMDLSMYGELEDGLYEIVTNGYSCDFLINNGNVEIISNLYSELVIETKEVLDTTIETNYFSLELPETFVSNTYYSYTDDTLSIYDKSAYDSNCGGLLGCIAWRDYEDFDFNPIESFTKQYEERLENEGFSFEVELLFVNEQDTGAFCMIKPTEDQWNANVKGGKKNYTKLQNDFVEAAKNITEVEYPVVKMYHNN